MAHLGATPGIRAVPARVAPRLALAEAVEAAVRQLLAGTGSRLREEPGRGRLPHTADRGTRRLLADPRGRSHARREVSSCARAARNAAGPARRVREVSAGPRAGDQPGPGRRAVTMESAARRAVTLQISLAPNDLPHAVHTVPHQLRQLAGQVDEIDPTLDLHRSGG